MNISITPMVQKKVEQNRNLLAPLERAISELQHLPETYNQNSNVKVLSEDISVIRDRKYRIYFTVERNNLVILDIEEKGWF
jgi:mRNA-degrading endonuclease RelE of RelBE toxin-antitoxin system